MPRILRVACALTGLGRQLASILAVPIVRAVALVDAPSHTRITPAAPILLLATVQPG